MSSSLLVMLKGKSALDMARGKACLGDTGAVEIEVRPSEWQSNTTLSVNGWRENIF